MDRIQLRSDREGCHRVAAASRGASATRFLPAAFLLAAATASGCDGTSSVGFKAAHPERDTILFEAEFVPKWGSSPTQPPVEGDSILHTGPPTAVVYLDVSRPMGGFLPTADATQQDTGANQFRTVVQWVPDQLTRAYPNAVPRWRAVGRDVTPLSARPRIDRSDFAAPASRIDLAMQTALADLSSGRSEAAAIVTDLLGTGDNLYPGPLALLRHLDPWLDSELVRSGELHLGLIGARAAYWGVASHTCPLEGGLGCWYSERAGEWRRMDGVASAPFYVLLMGRNVEAMGTIIESIESDAEGQGIETEREILTAASRLRQSSGSCLAFALGDDGNRALDDEGTPEQQFSLGLRDSNEYACLPRDESVSLGCRFHAAITPNSVAVTPPDTVVLTQDSGAVAPDPEGAPRSATEPVAGSPDGFTAGRSDITPDGEFEIGVHCKMLREAEKLPDLLIDIEASLPDDDIPPEWDDWSIVTDDLPSFPGKTLQLRYFVQSARLKPDFHRADSVAILRAWRP